MSNISNKLVEELLQEISNLKSENERLKYQIEYLELNGEVIADDYKKLREALVKIANSDSSGPDTDGLIEIAKEALKI